MFLWELGKETLKEYTYWKYGFKRSMGSREDIILSICPTFSPPPPPPLYIVPPAVQPDNMTLAYYNIVNW